MFFTRLRTHTKWVFVLLAVAFAIGFVAFGVGAGGTGIGDAIQGLFGAGDDTPSVAEARADVAAHPNDPQALLDLANVLQGERQFAEAAGALESYTKLRPDDTSGLEQLAAVYGSRIQQLRTQQSLLQSGSGSNSFGSSVFSFPGTSGFLGAIGQDPLEGAESGQSQVESQRLFDAAVAIYAQEMGVYERLTKLTPDDPQAFLLLGDAATQAQRNDKALPAYERFLELAPDDPLAQMIKEQVAQLKAAS